MKVLQLFYPHLDAFGNRSGFNGWPAEQDYLMSLALSCLQLVEIYGRVELITNQLGKEILAGALQLPYAHVDLSLEAYDDPLARHLPALPKIHALQQQHAPFMYVSSDVYAWDQLSPLPEAVVTSLAPKHHDQHSFRAARELVRVCAWLPYCVAGEQPFKFPVRAYDANLLAIRDPECYRQYARLVQEFVERNRAALPEGDPYLVNCAVDEFLFAGFVHHAQMPHPCLVPYALGLQRNAYDVFEASGKKQKFSLVGPEAKQREDITRHLSNQLRCRHPQHHRLVDAYCRDHERRPAWNAWAGSVAGTGGGPAPDTNGDGAAPTEYAEPLSGADAADAFARTLAGLQLCGEPPSDGERVLPEAVFLRRVEQAVGGLAAGNHKDVLLDALQFETAIWRFAREMRAAESLPDLQLSNHARYEALCRLDQTAFLEQTLTRSPAVTLVESRWKWAIGLRIKDLSRLKVIYNLSAGPDAFATLLMPDAGPPGVLEYELTDPEAVILALFETPRTAGAVITALGEYFEQDDVRDQRQALAAAAVERIKKFCYLGVLS